MSELNCEGLIPPFIEYLVAGAKSFDSIVPALDERATRGGIIIHRWWEDGTKQRIAIIKELDDLRSVRPTGKAYYVVPQSVVDQVAEWDRKQQLGIFFDRIVQTSHATGEPSAPGRPTPIEKLGLRVKINNALHRGNIHTIEQALDKTEDELLELRNFWTKSLQELREKLIEHGYADPNSEGISPIKRPEKREVITVHVTMEELLGRTSSEDSVNEDDLHEEAWDNTY